MKKLLLPLCIVMMTIACGTEVVDRRNFISSDVQINEGNSEETLGPNGQNQEPNQQNQEQPDVSDLPLSTLEWNGVDTIGTNKLGVLSISREGVQ